jgi:hypothetical protein
MDVTQKGLVTLLRSAITGQTQPLPEGFRLEDGLELTAKHHMAPLIYEGAAVCGLPLTDPSMGRMFHTYCRAVQVSDGQMAEIARIFAAFGEAGVDYLPLKGCNMKLRYPKPELRSMGDGDILIRMAQYDRIRPILEQLGFTFKVESDHELIWQSPKLLLELHKHLIPSYNADYYAYFGEGWAFAHAGAGHRHDMTPEDEFVYLFGHFTKHFRDGGIGCRHVVDLWVYLRACPELDMEKVTAALEKLQLLEFFGHIRRLIDWWFGDGAGDEHLEMISDFIFASGSWGRMEEKILSWNLRSDHGRASHLRQTLFPGVGRLKGQYPVLQKAPWLLPAIWVYRPIYKLLFDRRAVKRQEQKLRVLTRENLQARQKFLTAVGLQFRQ